MRPVFSFLLLVYSVLLTKALPVALATTKATNQIKEATKLKSQSVYQKVNTIQTNRFVQQQKSALFTSAQRIAIRKDTYALRAQADVESKMTNDEYVNTLVAQTVQAKEEELKENEDSHVSEEIRPKALRKHENDKKEISKRVTEVESVSDGDTLLPGIDKLPKCGATGPYMECFRVPTEKLCVLQAQTFRLSADRHRNCRWDAAVGCHMGTLCEF